MDDIWQMILAAIAALAAVGLTLKFVVNRSRKKSTVQKGNVVGGDMAGRDINKR